MHIMKQAIVSQKMSKQKKKCKKKSASQYQNLRINNLKKKQGQNLDAVPQVLFVSYPF